MAAWVKCTTTKGEMIFVNLDNASTMMQRGMRKETTLCLVGGADSIEVKETPEDLISSSAGGRAMRRTD
jgi:hypothetical protein